MAAVAALAGYGVAHYINHRPPAAVQTPATAPEFALRDLAGKSHRLAEWRGKLVLLNFWATWCPPCREEIPLFIDLQRRYAGQGLQIVGISIDDPAAVARYWQDMKINYPLLLADDATLDLMACGNLAMAPLVTHRVPVERAADMYRMIDERSEPFLGIIFEW